MKIKLKEIIAQFISSADLSEHQFMRLWNIAVRGHKQFNLDVYGNFKSVLLYVNDNKTVDLPDDFLTFSKLGVLNEVGEVVTLRRNDNMTTLHDQYLSELGKVTNVPVVQSGIIWDDPTRFPYYWLNYVGTSGIGYHLYGLPSGAPSIGEYTIDEDEKMIYLSSDWPYQSVMLEYLSDGYDGSCEDYMVDIKASEAMLSWIRWQNAIDSRKKFTQGDVVMYRQEYYNERRKAKIRLNSVDIREMQKIFRSSVRLAARA